MLALSSPASALIWCEDQGGQTQVTQRSVTRSTETFENYAECSFDAASGVYSCVDYCATGATLAKFHCSLHQPGSVRLAKRDYVDCSESGYAGCYAGACVAKMPAVLPSLAASPSPKPRAWCKPVNALSASAPSAITGAKADGSAYAFTDYCSDGRTLSHYSCSGNYYRVELQECASSCKAGLCVDADAFAAPSRDSDYGAWMLYGVAGVFLVAMGIAFWFYVSSEKTRLARQDKP
ncbi:MAG: hypothetical protein V1817_00070, partial [Candidatus Micrarchaeota archaeon]